MGGSTEWVPGYRMEDICSNLVPLEIALKIAEKIKAREPFAAYIVLPLWPEGAPVLDHGHTTHACIHLLTSHVHLLHRRQSSC